ncbi:MAG: diphthamide biosynthesis enzyme Dph2 [Candidatus Thermoplasmatota archaeon]|nr:diphthamide biosynthesis enzyme Dph2 [Candidatus Thermoplasmatota archaeon]
MAWNGDAHDAIGRSTFNVDIDAITRAVYDSGAKVVGLQLPEGLKRLALPIVESIVQATGATIVLSADPCYGACDLVDDQFEPLDVQLIIHVGHSPLGDTEPRIPTVFLEAPSRLDIGPAVRASLYKLGRGGRIGLLTTTQHRHTIRDARSILENAGYEVAIGTGGKRLAFPGQVLGCDLSAARDVENEVDTFLIVGGGTFHAIGVAMSTRRPVVIADVETGEARTVQEDLDRVLRRRSATIGAAMDAKTFGIIIEARPGQRRWNLAQSLADMLIDSGRRPVLMVLRNISPDRLVAIGLDAYVNTACPRLTIDDQSLFPMPLLTPMEMRIMLGRDGWDDYMMDEFD